MNTAALIRQSRWTEASAAPHPGKPRAECGSHSRGSQPLLRRLRPASCDRRGIVEQEKGRESMNRKDSPPRDLTLLGIAVVLMLGGAVTLVGGWLPAGIAIPLIAPGIPLVVIARRAVRHQHA